MRDEALEAWILAATRSVSDQPAWGGMTVRDAQESASNRLCRLLAMPGASQ
jgi:hypothetical protein